MEFQLLDKKSGTVFLIVFAFIHLSDAVKCRICEFGVKSQDQCLKVADCINLDVCYTELYIENDGSQTFYSGCRSRQECENNNAFVGTIVGKRDALDPRARVKRDQKTGQNICTACCDTDFCNEHQCNLSPADQTTSTCYKCDNVASLDDCTQLTVCSDTERCYTAQKYAGGGMTVYSMGCELIQICDLRELFLNTGGIVGRRAIDDDRSICLSCCPYSYCNRLEDCSKNQRAPSLSTPQPSLDTSTASTAAATSPPNTDTPSASSSTTSANPSTTTDTTTTQSSSTITSTQAQQSTSTSTSTQAQQSTSTATSAQAQQSTSTSTSTQGQQSTTSPQQSTSTPKTTTARTRGHWCYECSGDLCGVVADPPVLCNSSAPYCLNSYVQEVGKTPSVTKSCTDEATCDLKWYEGTSDRDECFKLSVHQSLNVACYYCCVDDYCNDPLVPNANTLYNRN